MYKQFGNLFKKIISVNLGELVTYLIQLMPGDHIYILKRCAVSMHLKFVNILVVAVSVI